MKGLIDKALLTYDLGLKLDPGSQLIKKYVNNLKTRLSDKSTGSDESNQIPKWYYQAYEQSGYK